MPRFLEALRTEHPPTRVARLVSYGVEWLVGSSSTGPITVLAPAEEIRLFAVDLPASRHRDRLAALPWAIEELLSEPVTSLHLILGAAISSQRYLAAAVRHGVMAQWEAILAAEGLTRCRIVPDALALPLPTEAAWSVAVDADRVLVRCADSTAFTVESDLFLTIWRNSDRPALCLYGDQSLPGGLIAAAIGPASETLEFLLIASANHVTLNLAQGHHAPKSDVNLMSLRRAAIVLGAGIVAYTIVLAIDTVAMVHLASLRTADAARLEAEIIPAQNRSTDVAADLAALERVGSARHALFLPLLGRASAALKPFSSEVSLRSMGFSAEDAALSLGVEVRDFAALQKVEAALTSSGIAVETGPAATIAGGVEAKLKLRTGNAR